MQMMLDSQEYSFVLDMSKAQVDFVTRPWWPVSWPCFEMAYRSLDAILFRGTRSTKLRPFSMGFSQWLHMVPPEELSD